MLADLENRHDRYARPAVLDEGRMCIRRPTWLRPYSKCAAPGECRPTSLGRLVAAIAPFADPELWLRACALAALRARDGSVGLEVVSLSTLCERGRNHGPGFSPRPVNGGSHDDPPDPASERPLSVRLQLWWLGKVELFVLKHMPKGPRARHALSWVDQSHVRIRQRLGRNGTGEKR